MINLLLVGLATGGFWNVRAFVVCISVRNMTYCRQAIATISEQLDMYRPRCGEILYEGVRYVSSIKNRRFRHEWHTHHFRVPWRLLISSSWGMVQTPEATCQGIMHNYVY